MLRGDAEHSGFRPHSKAFCTRYIDQCRQLMALKRETEKFFRVAIIREGTGVSLWKGVSLSATVVG